MKQEQLNAIKEEYSNMDWEDFRENAGDLITREIEIYNNVVIEGVPALLAEVERLREALEKIMEVEAPIAKGWETSVYKIAQQALGGESNE